MSNQIWLHAGVNPEKKTNLWTQLLSLCRKGSMARLMQVHNYHAWHMQYAAYTTFNFG